jgi:hypothetical protein
LFAWLTLLPDWTPLPVNSQLRDMMHLFFFSASVHALAGLSAQAAFRWP